MATTKPNPCLYSELPKSCPHCQEKFSQVNFRRSNPRRYRLSAKLMFAGILLIGILTTLAMGLIGILAAGIASVAPTLAVMKMDKKVRMNCKNCNWKSKFVIVSYRTFGMGSSPSH
jgi:hypothetical protein